MEKQRNITKCKSLKRLLIWIAFSILFLNSAAAQALTLAQINQLRITPAENQKLYAKSEIKFEVILPNVSAASVQVQNPGEPKGVTFKTLRKTEMYTGTTGTKIELWFVFDKQGKYKLPPLSTVINNRNRTIQFDEVIISDDPANLPARFVIEFNNGTTVYSDDNLSKKTLFTAAVGEEVQYTIYLQHAVQLIQFNWELPKDSILTQTQSYEITESKYSEKRNTDELIPVASFEWVALSEGKHIMPVIRLSATGYNGYRNAIVMPEFYIEFTKNIAKEIDEADSLFVEAFNSYYIHSAKTEMETIPDELCEELARLRREERLSFADYNPAKRKRKAFEEEHNFPAAQGEYPVCMLYISIILLIGLGLVFAYYVKCKQHLAKILTMVAIICAFVIMFNSSVQISKRFAIIKKTAVLSVPEENATSSNELTSGTRVRILEETDNWAYIEVGEIGGWVSKDRLCKI